MIEIDGEVQISDGLTVRIAWTDCGEACRGRHFWVVLGWADADRWCAVDPIFEDPDYDGDTELDADEAEAAVQPRDRDSLMLWGVPWARMSHNVAVEQVSQQEVMFMVPGLWEEYDAWPEESLALLTRMRPLDFSTPRVLLAYTRAYRHDLGGTRGVV